ncbi:MAG: L-threonylcarbamoyladenylate synthase [Paracoccus sp. (in: a-proteobacteria)]|uniref:L-threonylcarbamoyladenylate synthase n=1 Tax=Paracoccus sp. TaxID=267 RepID=UPI0026E0BE34|nr:L-threonylcarbamoyladenylate synthase [Paracoccus sp. (in: a-proteobacteria)]MDO5621458.1 L-threonylcarbamoyladenylate synthase [Paracoccus sp. (in: a-proteobacteria)]
MAKTRILSADSGGISQAAELLRAGSLVAIPTETVYGLAADARNDHAVAGIFAAKGRPTFNPLIVHLPDPTEAARIAHLPAPAEALARAFWPGALTLVLPLRPDAGISPLVTAGGDTVALRVPAHPVAQALLRQTGPLAAPSANPSGRISASTAAHVLDGLDGRIAAVLDAGPCAVGLESTIIGWREGHATLLRPGGISSDAIEAISGPLDRPQINAGADARPDAPGQLTSHYAPRQPLRMGATTAHEGEILIGFGPGPADMNLSPSGNLVEAAANLFATLHRADAMGRPIAVTPIPDTGLGLAINDRLRRAAAPR